MRQKRLPNLNIQVINTVRGLMFRILPEAFHNLNVEKNIIVNLYLCRRKQRNFAQSWTE